MEKSIEEQLKELNEWIDDFYEQKKRLKRHPVLRTLFIETTFRCNAKCEHCGSSCGYSFPKDEITLDEIKKVLKGIADNKNYDPRNIMVNITGGEPLMRKDVFEITKYANELGFPWGMTSNGFLITKNVVDKMVETGMYSISISLDGVEKTHEEFRKVPGGFKKLIEGVKLMLERPEIKVVQITTCVNKRNIEELPQIYEIVKNAGVKYWRLVEVDAIGRAKNNNDLLLEPEDIKRMLEYIEKMQKNKDGIEVMYGGCGHFIGRYYEEYIRNIPAYCGAGTLVASILSNGDISACPDIERRPEMIQGNIRKDDFIDVWENRFKIYRSIRATCNNKCKNCNDWKLCTGDGFHTWDFDNNKPTFCCKEIFGENEYR